MTVAAAPSFAPGVAGRTLDGSTISACLLTYNHVGVIGSTLDSILAQTLTGFELLVSDDCSDDGTWQLVCRRAAADPRIVAVQTPRNLGMAGNANFAVSQTRRPLIALLHHDDLYRPELLARWYASAARHPDVGFVFNAYESADGRRMGHPFSVDKLDGTWFLERHLLLRWGCPVRGTALIRRSAWDAIGGMREEFGLLADVDLWMRLAARGPVGYVPEPLIIVRHVRPAYYPADYQNTGWSWRRQRYLYEIHARNHVSHYGSGSARDRLAQLRFRTRLSLETAKWLSYGLVRRRWPMIDDAGESATPYDQRWLRVFRAAAGQLARLRSGRPGPA